MTKLKEASQERIVFPVGGMHCASCVAKIESAVGKVKGVSKVSVDLATRTVSIAGELGSVGIAASRKAIEKAGYEVLGTGLSADAELLGLSAQEEEARILLRRFLVSAALSLPLMAGEALSLSPFTSLLIATPLQIWGGWHFHRGLALSLLRQTADMNTLVSISTWAAYLFSASVVLWPVPALSGLTPQWDAVAGLVTLVTLGRWLESRMRGRTSQAVLKLMRLTPKTVRVLRQGSEFTVGVGEVAVGEIFLVKPGEQVGLDGVVEKGASTVDESLLTGESLPVEKSPGSPVWGGAINKSGSLEIAVTRRAEESALSRLVAAVRESLATKPRIQQYVDKVAAIFVPVVIAVGVASAVFWALYGPEPRQAFALTAFISVLASACPCALGLATPLALIAGIGRAAELGVFIRNADVIERAGALDAVLFDKTGTLTEGKPSVVSVLVQEGSESELLLPAAAAGSRSDHPYAEAVALYARGKGMAVLDVDSFESLPGRGVSIQARGKTVRLGSLAWLKETGCALPAGAWPVKETRGPLVGVCEGELFRGAFTLSDELRPSARRAVAELKAMGLEVILVSGDRNASAYRAAELAGINNVFAEILPEEKAKIVERLRAEGKTVAMVGEGFNDAPALSRADVGVALASGTDIASESSDIILVNPDLSVLAEAFRLCRKIRVVIRQNLFWAFAYNVLLIPVAAGALYPAFGVMLKPHYAAAAMALSSISVALNSLRLRKNT